MAGGKPKSSPLRHPHGSLPPFHPILILGSPGCGKTTLVRRLVERFPDHARGFYTEELRDSRGRRYGFDIVRCPDGERRALARVHWSDEPLRVGKYGVRVQGLEEMLPNLSTMETQQGFWVVDELGKMESFSPAFLSWLERILAPSLRPSVLTGPARPVPAYRTFLDRVRPHTLHLTRSRFHEIERVLYEWLAGALPAR